MGGSAQAAFSNPDDNVAGSRGSRNRGDGGATSTDPARRAISSVAGEAGSKVASSLDAQKSKAAEGLGSVAQALRQTSDQLRDKDQGPLHQYVASAADQVERFSGYLRSKNVNEMVSEIEQFARRQPALFLGGAFMLGLLGARFLKSSSQGTGGGYGAMQGRNLGYHGGMEDRIEGSDAGGSYSTTTQGSLRPQDPYAGTTAESRSTDAVPQRRSSEYSPPGTSTPPRGAGSI